MNPICPEYLVAALKQICFRLRLLKARKHQAYIFTSCVTLAQKQNMPPQICIQKRDLHNIIKVRRYLENNCEYALQARGNRRNNKAG